MLNKLRFTTPIPPSVNDYLGYRVLWNRGKAIVSPYKKQVALKYVAETQRNIREALKTQPWEEAGKFTYVVCSVDIFSNTKRRDGDNMFKLLLDAIKDTEGVLYDDCLIIPRVRDIIIDANNPRLEVELTIPNKYGIFTRESYEGFVSKNCLDCNRFSRNCKIIKEAGVENKLRPEIDLEELVCSARKLKKKKK